MKHSQLITFARELGYGHNNLITEKGLCRGFSAMWIQAVCCGDLDSFNQRLSLIKTYNSPKKLKKDVNEALEFSKEKKKLTKKQQKLLEIPAFFEGIALYLSPNGLNTIAEKSLYQNNVIEVSKYLQSQKLEEKGGLALAFQTTDQYMPPDLIRHLKNISNELKDKTDVAINLSANNHSVAIRVVGNDKFLLIDTNYLTKKDRIYNSKELADQLYSSFPNKSTWLDLFRKPKTPPLIMSTSVFTNGNNSLNIEPLRNTIALKDLPTDTATSLLINAAYNNDIALLKRINFDKINFVYMVDSLLVANHYNDDDGLTDYLLNKIDKNITESYALHTIATTKNLKPKILTLIKKLIEKGINLNQQDSNGYTPFLLALQTGNTLLAAEFLNYEADFNIRNKKNVSALEIACKHNQTIFIPLLLKDTTLTRKDFLPNSPLIKLIPKYDADTQNFFLKKALETYIDERNNGADYLNFFNMGINKKDKVSAANALLDKLNGIEVNLDKHQKALNNGILSSLYKFYKSTSKKIPLNPNNKPSSYSHAMTHFDVTKASRNQMPLNPTPVKKTEVNLGSFENSPSAISSFKA